MTLFYLQKSAGVGRVANISEERSAISENV